MANNTPKIAIKDLHKRFGDKIVLDGVNLDVPEGQSVVIIGGSGTGKSVLLKNILGLLSPEKGSIQIDNQNVVAINLSERERVLQKVGMLFQNAALFDSLTVWENVAFGLIEGRGMKRKEAREIAIAKLADVGLGADIGIRSPAELSGGMRKRVGLARAIATDPEIIFFDEPTTGLDPIMGDVINDLIVDRVKHLGATTLTITHDMASARRIADKIAMIYKGKIIWAGPVSEIDASGNDFVDQFIHGRADGPIQMDVRAG
ncbi:MAG: ATP-binding cassette domain-containing protein [Alphaproteobacteria bacterium]|nr:ATP-binding cassette domain-containing protein [Alphaproteobacteria bacterium]